MGDTGIILQFKTKSGNLQFVMCGLVDSKKDDVSDAGEFKPRKVQSKFLFFMCKGWAEEKKINEKMV